MPVHDIELTEIAVPDFGLPAMQPSVSGQEYTQRVAQVRTRMVEEGLTHLIVYGDREHLFFAGSVVGRRPARGTLGRGPCGSSGGGRCPEVADHRPSMG